MRKIVAHTSVSRWCRDGVSVNPARDGSHSPYAQKVHDVDGCPRSLTLLSLHINDAGARMGPRRYPDAIDATNRPGGFSDARDEHDPRA